MSYPLINTERCSKDHACVSACPTNRLRVDPSGHPEVDATVACLSCGHCVTACPMSALTLSNAPNNGLEALTDDWRIGPERVSQFLRGRRSIRAYREQPLTRATIEELLQVAQYAPSGHNSQPLAWTVVYEKERVRAITEATVEWMRRAVEQASPLVRSLNMPAVLAAWDAGQDTVCRGAPHLIIAHAAEQFPAGMHSAAIAITYLELAAASRGVGTCWAGFVFVGAGASPELHASLGLPPGQRCAGAILAGYPAISYHRIPVRRAPTIHWM